MFNDLLFELGSEELPSGAVKPLGEALKVNLVAALEKANLSYGSVKYFATPRRLAVLIHDVQCVQASQRIVRRGPSASSATDANGNPTQALMGFAKSCGVSVDALTLSKTDKGEWWCFETEQAGEETLELLPAIIQDAVMGLPIAKPMRWGAGVEEFARPVHWAVLLFGDSSISTSVLGVNTGRISYGHRYHHPEALTITEPKHYESLMKAAFVLADFDLRRHSIVEQVEQLVFNQDQYPVMPDELLDEVTSIVEWPHALLATFDREFLEVPAEALIAAMQSHQKCFALRDSEARLLPAFITISNIESQHPQQVIAGNEKVMRARLSDAAFFFNQDKKRPLSDYRASTARVVFQKQLGTLADKAVRICSLMMHFARVLNLDLSEACRAADLSKCDLMTGMVGEFPELQGLMGYYYARLDGESDAVSCALNEQYKPRFAADSLPESVLGLALSLADRLDTLVGAFTIGQKPSGTKDPFKLRRHALAVVRLLIHLPVSLSLLTLIDKTRMIYGDTLPDNKKALDELSPFIFERLQSFYHQQGVSLDLVHAAKARQDDCLFDLDKRIKALQTFIHLPEAASLTAACKRVNNLLQQALLTSDHQNVDLSLLKESAEINLFERIQAIETRVAPYYSQGDYGFILTCLASLHEPVDCFFDDVMVMVDNLLLRQNRLCLLARLQQLLQGVADISLLQIAP